MIIYPTVFPSYCGVDISPLTEESLCLPIIVRVVGTPQFPPSLNSSQDPVLPDDHCKTPYPGSPVGGLFGQINKQNPFEFKLLS